MAAATRADDGAVLAAIGARARSGPAPATDQSRPGEPFPGAADTEPSRTLAVEDVRELASALGVPAKRVECIALRSRIIPERYSRNLASFSPEDQASLLESSVTVVGAGGLGGWLAEILARSGVGMLRLIDGDTFDGTNLNRQLFSEETTLGRTKVEVAAERLLRVNSSVDVEPHAAYLTAENGERLVAGSVAVADCLDSIHARYVLQDAAAASGVPLVSAAVGGTSGQLLTILPGDAGLRSLYGDRDGVPDRGEEVLLGNLPFTVAAVASLQAAEIVRILLGKPPLHRNRLLLVDLSAASFEQVSLG